MRYFILTIICVGFATLLLWVIHLKLQIRSISRQLENRLHDGSRCAIYASLGDKDIVRIVSALNRCFDEEENAKLALEREEKDFRTMIANISHDLRTPLTSIKGYLQLLSATNLDSRQRRKLHIIVKHANELGNLIESFFEYSYLLNDDTPLNPERFNLTDEVTECLAAAVPQLESRHIAVSLEEHPPVFVTADRTKTIRIIQNLIRNCIQHSAGNIQVEVTRQDGQAVMSFSNPVKNPADIDTNKIFDRFYTAEKSRGKSTGLGLSIVKLLIGQMGGTVKAKLLENVLTITVTIQ